MAREPEPPDFPASQLFLRRLAYSLVHDSALAEDLVQDTWTAWLERGPRGLAQPRAWLARVLRNRAFNVQRGAARRARREAELGPDPSTPETDGTLEAQARLLEALRRLEEPYRSTLVQRYYHDLAPSVIAERTGTPLNTVKARLARGLERLRVDLDRRYGGDRGAWCHWLLTIGNRAVPAGPAVGSTSATALGATALTGASSASASLGAWSLCLAAAFTVLGWVLWHTKRPAAQVVAPEQEAEVGSAPVALAPPRREPVRPRLGAARTTPAEPAPIPTPAPPQSAAPPLPFDWPQLAGIASHDNFGAFRSRTDLILSPFVLATYPGLSGQVTIAGTELYSGGASLWRLDLVAGVLQRAGEKLEERMNRARHGWRADERSPANLLAQQGLDPQALVAAAPALTPELVIARFVADGSVSGVERDLQFERWHWDPREPAFCPLSGCLVRGSYIAAHRHEVVSLSAINGAVEWRFETGAAGEVDTVPASSGDLVYFATDRGAVFCLEVATGKELWRVETGRAPGGRYPVAFADRVVLADGGELGDQRPWAAGGLRALQSYDGRELWKTWCTSGQLGTGDGCVYAADRSWVRAVSVETGNSVAFFEFWSKAAPAGAPTVVGDSLYSIEADLIVRALETRAERWRLRASKDAALLDFVHTGDRIYVSTAGGLVCIADDEHGQPAPPGFVLEGDRTSRKR